MTFVIVFLNLSEDVEHTRTQWNWSKTFSLMDDTQDLTSQMNFTQ